MPAPASGKPVRRSMTVTPCPRRLSARAVVRPPMPAPTMMTLSATAASGSGGGAPFPDTGRRACLVLAQRRIVDEARGAIGAQDVVVAAHVDEDVRVVEGGRRADAHELPGADADDLDARVVVEMGYAPVGHCDGPALRLTGNRAAP